MLKEPPERLNLEKMWQTTNLRARDRKPEIRQRKMFHDGINRGDIRSLIILHHLSPPSVTKGQNCYIGMPPFQLAVQTGSGLA
jgi:hypothetical protein